jgi:hypothetical protein
MVIVFAVLVFVADNCFNVRLPVMFIMNLFACRSLGDVCSRNKREAAVMSSLDFNTILRCVIFFKFFPQLCWQLFGPPIILEYCCCKYTPDIIISTLQVFL